MTLLSAIDHVQLAMPRGEEAKARTFYGNVLGMGEAQKPPLLVRRGGVWFTSGPVQVHLGVEDDFRPAKKAHPAFKTSHGQALSNRLIGAGYQVRSDDAIDGVSRFFTDDCFGNRLEFIEVGA